MYIIFFILIFILLARNSFVHNSLEGEILDTWRELNAQITLLTDEVKTLENQLGYSYVKNYEKSPSHKLISGKEREEYLKKLEREQRLSSPYYRV